MEDNKTASISSTNCKNIFESCLAEVQYVQTQKVKVDKCDPEFFFRNIRQSYPLFKNPRGLCLIINIYQIDKMPPRRWSERDTDALKQLFEELLFDTRVYTDSTHDLTAPNLMQIIRDFSKCKEHEEAQCCVVCLMSHGEEGCLTSKEGDKVLLDDVFNMFNNVNCPYLAGKPKLFFIQSCRDDPVSGPAEDFGVRLSINSQHIPDQADNADKTDNNETDGCLNQVYHMPSLCDMLIGFPTQKGYIAYRKPEIGSWYMNAIVQVFSKHAKNTDLCAMLNMVNALISNEVTNMGRKQMSEYTSKFTRPYFYFYPGFALEAEALKLTGCRKSLSSAQSDDNLLVQPHNISQFKQLKRSHSECLNIEDNVSGSSKRKPCKNTLINRQFNLKTQNTLLVNNESDSSNYYKNLLTHKHIMFISNKARNYWKEIAREMDISESQINEIDGSCDQSNDLAKKLYQVITIWVNTIGHTKATYTKLIDILSLCKLNAIKEDLIVNIQEASDHTIIDELITNN